MVHHLASPRLRRAGMTVAVLAATVALTEGGPVDTATAALPSAGSHAGDHPRLLCYHWKTQWFTEPARPAHCIAELDGPTDLPAMAQTLRLTKLRWLHWAADHARGTGRLPGNHARFDTRRFHLELSGARPRCIGDTPFPQFTRLHVTGHGVDQVWHFASQPCGE